MMNVGFCSCLCPPLCSSSALSCLALPGLALLCLALLYRVIVLVQERAINKSYLGWSM